MFFVIPRGIQSITRPFLLLSFLSLLHSTLLTTQVSPTTLSISKKDEFTRGTPKNFLCTFLWRLQIWSEIVLIFLFGKVRPTTKFWKNCHSPFYTHCATVRQDWLARLPNFKTNFLENGTIDLCLIPSSVQPQREPFGTRPFKKSCRSIFEKSPCHCKMGRFFVRFFLFSTPSIPTWFRLNRFSDLGGASGNPPLVPQILQAH
jgi:hypothetical protein